jgi:CRP-like cAMP-binding protein
MSSSSSCNIKEDSSPPPKKNSKYSNDPLYVIILETKIKQAYQMKVFKQTFDQLLTKSASLPITCASKKEPNRQPLLIAHIDHCFQVVRRILLKLLSIEFPKEFNVQVLIEGLESDLVEIHETIQEVLENLIPSATYKHLVLPLFFSKNNFLPKIAQKIIKEIKKNQFETNFFKETQWILDMIKHDMSHEELYALAFEFYLEIHPQHQPINFSEEHFKRLLASEWTQELLVELAHETAAMIDGTTSTCSTGQEKNRILSDSIRDLLFKIPRPLISRVSISSCLRASALFENVCALDLLLMLSHRFGCKELDEGMTFATENDLATAMYIVASGRIQLHKNGKVLAELGYGACIGQAALLRHSLHAGNHVASATTLTKCLLLMVSREDLDALMKDVPRVSRGVLNAVASSLRWLYFEPLSELAQSGNLPSRRESKAMRYSIANHQERRHFASTTSAALSVDRAAKSFLHQIGRDRVSDPPLRTFATTSGEGSRSLKRSISHAITSTTTFDSQATASSTGVASTTESLVESSCTVEYTNFEKCIHLKGSQLMKNLDDEKVSLVANVSRVVTFGHGEVVYFDQHPADTVYIVIEGNIAVYRPQAKNDQQKETIKAKTQVFAEFHDGDCFGEEVSFIKKRQYNKRN